MRSGFSGSVPRRIVWVIGKETKKQQQPQRNQANRNDFIDARVALRGFDF